MPEQESSQPNIHEQTTDEGSVEFVTSENKKPLTETANKRLEDKIRKMFIDIRASLGIGGKTENDIKESVDQLNNLSLELTGKTIELLDIEQFESKTLDEYEKALNEGPQEYNGVVTHLSRYLTCFESERAWNLRDQLSESGDSANSLVIGLAGIDSPKSWEIRDKVSKNPKDFSTPCLLASLAGVDSERAWEMRNKYIESNPGQVAQSLVGVDSERAWEAREKIFKVSFESVATSLAGLDSPKAWEMRDTISKLGADPSLIAEGIVGLDSEKAWEMRESLDEKHKGLIAQGLAGIESERAWHYRRQLLAENEHGFSGYVLRGLAGCDSPEAQEMREELLSKGASQKDYLSGMNGDWLPGIAWRAVRGLLPYQLEQKDK